MSLEKSQLYQEEFKTIFIDKKSLRVRGALVISAFIEGQILLLAKSFLEQHNIKYDPPSNQEFWQSVDILKANGRLTPKELKDMEKFRKERNKAIHGPFKGMTRKEWEEQNNIVVKLGRPIVKNLDEKLYPEI